AHGVLGGVKNVLLGGKFKDGFLSAAASTAFGAYVSYENIGLGSPGDTSKPYLVAARTSVAAVIGGTVSEVGGGKFANGAYTAAFQHLFNAELKKSLLVHAKTKEFRVLARSELLKLGKLTAKSKLEYGVVIGVYRGKYIASNTITGSKSSVDLDSPTFVDAKGKNISASSVAILAGMHSHPSAGSSQIYTQGGAVITTTYFSSSANNASGAWGGGDFAAFSSRKMIGGVIATDGGMQLLVPNLNFKFKYGKIKNGVLSDRSANKSWVFDLK
ncbi:MAG: hypothetical protein ACSHX7_14775, partial [Luteolibacter sp.]